MTPRLSTWLFGHNPRIPLLVLGGLWIAQVSLWALWEWQREPIRTVEIPLEAKAPPPAMPVEAPVSNVLPQIIPDSPFQTQNSTVLSRYFDYADFNDSTVDPPSDPPAPPPPDPLPPPPAESPAVPEQPQIPAAETNGVAFARALRYRGFIQTPQSGKIAFVEDVDAASTHRLKTGDTLKDWTLRAIERKHVVFESSMKTRVEILRREPDPEPTPAAPVTTPTETPPSGTNAPPIRQEAPPATQAPASGPTQEGASS